MRPDIEKHLQKLHFRTWLKDLNLPVCETEEEKIIHLLTSGPHSLVKSWQAHDITDVHSIPRQRTIGVSAKIVV
jgi:hypothetical protein